MTVRVRTVTGTIAVAVLFIAISGHHVSASGGIPCSDPHPATQVDVDVMGGKINLGDSVCPRDEQTVPVDSGAAKEYLKSLPRSGSASDSTNIDKLNASFTICAANFFKEFQQRYGSVIITSAYRSSAYDARMCVNNPACGNLMNNPAPNGNHQKGLAIDVRASAGQSTLWNFARSNPQFGVCFPFTGENGGFTDTVHMILAGIPGNETSGPGCRGVSRACDAGHFDPRSIQDAGAGYPGYPGQAVPVGTASQTGQNCVLSDGTVVSCSAIANRSSPPPAQSAPAQQPIAQTQPASTPTSSLINTSLASPQLASNSLQSTSSTSTLSQQASQLIAALANPAATPQKTVPPAPTLFVDGQNVATLQPIAPAQTIPPPASAYPLPQPISQQTFTSQDLGGVSQPPVAPASLSTMQAILENLKATLLRILEYLKPFGGSAPAQNLESPPGGPGEQY